MNILALDVATKTGWCTNVASGVWDFKVKRDESGGMRIIRFKSKIKEILESTEVDLVVFERSAGRNQSAVIVQSELHGVLKSICEDEGIPYRAYSASEIKKHATGKGNANKQKMVEAAKKTFINTDIIDDNHADAIWLYDLASNDYDIK